MNSRISAIFFRYFASYCLNRVGDVVNNFLNDSNPECPPPETEKDITK